MKRNRSLSQYTQNVMSKFANKEKSFVNEFNILFVVFDLKGVLI